MGRKLDVQTMTYRTSDSSGVAIPIELRHKVESIYDDCAMRRVPNGLAILSEQWAWQDRLKSGIKE